MVSQLGAKDYPITNQDLLFKDIEALSNNKIDKLTDTDKDGLSAYYEKNLKLFNGISIQTDINKPDTVLIEYPVRQKVI